MKRLNLLLLFLIFNAFTAFSQNPKVVDGVATYTSSTNIGRKFSVPNDWKKIIIKANVTLTGSFYMPTRETPIEIMGENRKTSIIQGDGSRPTDDGINGRSYSAIRADKSPDIYVHDLMVTKPMKFHIHGGFGNVTVERCDIVAGSYTHTTDGIHGGVGKTVVKDCYINCYDDALYTIECKLVENTTIVHNKNGGPFMTSWGNNVPNGHVCVIRNCTVIAGYDETNYNHGVVGWAGKSSASNEKETITLKFEGTFNYIVPSDKKASTFYTIGRPNDAGLNNGHIVIDGQCHYKNSIDLRLSKNSSVTFKNCEINSVTYSLTVNNGTGDGNFTAQSTKTITADPAPNGKVFDKWVVNSGNPSIVNANDPSTVITIPTANVSVTATYKDGIIDTKPTDIFNLSAKVLSCNSVNLTWSDVQKETAYRISRKLNSESTYINLTDLEAGSTSYTDKSVTSGLSYNYTVRPLVNGTLVANSNVANITLPICNNSEVSTTNCNPAIKFPGGRIALSFDGNVHDDDDIVALPLSMGLIWAAGLKDKIAHVEYNNHMCSHGTENDGSTNFQGDDAIHMRASANGSITRFGLDGNKLFDYSTNGTQATDNFIKAINTSSATNPLWIIAAGPMETVWRALNGAQANKRQFVTVISHSNWNQNHGDCGLNSHTWNDMVQNFSGNGVKFVESCGFSSNSPCTTQELNSPNYFPDQNISNGDNDFNTPIENWNWLKDSKNPNLSWIFTRNPFGNKFDPSDAGMVYFLLTGGPNNGGAKKAGWKEVKTLLENPCNNNANAENIGDETCAGFEEKNGLLVIEMENTKLTENWIKKSNIAGATGSGYIQWEGTQNFGSTTNGLIEIPIKINTPGTYEVRMRMAVANTIHGLTEHNDTWLKIKASNFYAEKDGVLMKPNPDCNSAANYICPKGSSVDGFFKMFGGGATWQWQNKTSDFNDHFVHATFDTPGEYKIIIAARSSFHALDRIIMYNKSITDRATAENISNPETLCSYSSNSNNNGLSDISDLTLTSSSCTSVNLSWSDISGEEGYKIRRKTPTTDYELIADVPANTTSYKDNTALENTTYQYTVRPTQKGISVAFSNIPVISTKICNTISVPVEKSINAFPVPTIDILYLPEVYAKDKINIISVQTGNIVLTKTITQTGSTQLDLRNQPAGSYIIQIIRGNQQLTRQIIKQ